MKPKMCLLITLLTANNNAENGPGDHFRRGGLISAKQHICNNPLGHSKKYIIDYGLLIQYFGAKWVWIGYGIRVESIRYL